MSDRHRSERKHSSAWERTPGTGRRREDYRPPYGRHPEAWERGPGREGEEIYEGWGPGAAMPGPQAGRYPEPERTHPETPNHPPDYGDNGDWGRQGAWGTFGNRPDWQRTPDWENQVRQVSRQQPREGAGFAGKGPKGWRRSDERILEDVSQALTDHSDLDAREIEVSVAGGEVRLVGSVPDRRSKRLAEDLAEAVSGVTDVHNELRLPGANAEIEAPSRQVVSIGGSDGGQN